MVQVGSNASTWTAMDLVHRFGAIPLDRVLPNPSPGTATVADVVRLDDHEDRLHSPMMLEALGVGIGQLGEPAVIHADRQIQPLNMRGRDSIFVWFAIARFLCGAYYLGWAVAGGFLSRGVLLYNHPKVHAIAEHERHIQLVGR